MYSSYRGSLRSTINSHSALQLLASLVLSIPLLVLIACFCTGLIWNQQPHEQLHLLSGQELLEQNGQGSGGIHGLSPFRWETLHVSTEDSSGIRNGLGSGALSPAGFVDPFQLPGPSASKYEAHSRLWNGHEQSNPYNPSPTTDFPSLGESYRISLMNLFPSSGYGKLEKRLNHPGVLGQDTDEDLESARSVDSSISSDSSTSRTSRTSGGSGPSINMVLASDHFRKVFSGEPIHPQELQQFESPRRPESKVQGIETGYHRANMFSDLKESREPGRQVSSIHPDDHEHGGTQDQRKPRGYDRAPNMSWLTRKEWKHPELAVQKKWEREQRNREGKLPAHQRTAFLPGHLDKHTGERVTIRPEWRTQSFSTPRTMWTDVGKIHRQNSMTSPGRYGGSRFLQGKSPLQILPGTSLRYPPHPS